MLQNVIDVGADDGEGTDLRQVGSRQLEVGVNRVAVDEQAGVDPQLAQLLRQNLGLAVGNLQVLQNDQLAFGLLGGQGHLQTQGADLLVQRELEITRARTVGLAALAELRGRLVAVASRAGTLLAVHLLRRQLHVAAFLRGAGRGAALGQLPGHNAVKDVGANFASENVLNQIDLADGSRIEVFNIDLHGLLSRLLGGRRFSRSLLSGSGQDG